MRRLLRIDPYHLAAGFYFFYGLCYLGGAIVALTPQRMGTFFGFVPWWAFYVAGGIMVVLLPLLVSRRYRWFTRIIAFGPAAKALTLCWRQGRLLGAAPAADVATDAANRASLAYDWFFLIVAVIAAVLLFRAGWGDRRPTPTGPGRP